VISAWLAQACQIRLEFAQIPAFQFAPRPLVGRSSLEMFHAFQASDVVVIVMTGIVVVLIAALQFSRRSSAPPPDAP